MAILLKKRMKSGSGIFRGKRMFNRVFGIISNNAIPSFNPQTQGTLVNWYDGSTLGLNNGDPIIIFTDSKTGNPNPLSGGTASPIFNTNQQNGLATVSFNGTTQMLIVGGSNSAIYPYTIAAVVKLNVLPVISSNILGPSGGGGLQYFLTNSTGIQGINSANTVVIATSSSGVSDGNYHLVVVIVTSTTYAFYLDGNLVGSGTHSVVLTGTNTFQMGTQTNGGSGVEMNGSIGEVQIYSSALGGTDLAGLHTYIVNKWATP